MECIGKKICLPQARKTAPSKLGLLDQLAVFMLQTLISSDEFNVSDVRKSSGIKTGRIKLQGETYKKHNRIKKETDYS